MVISRKVCQHGLINNLGAAALRDLRAKIMNIVKKKTNKNKNKITGMDRIEHRPRRIYITKKKKKHTLCHLLQQNEK